MQVRSAALEQDPSRSMIAVSGAGRDPEEKP
jgi:hypothetical protein